MKKIIIMMAFALSTQAFAKNPLQSLLENKSDKTAYQILEDQYSNDAGRPSRFSDLKTADLNNKTTTSPYNRCISVNKESPDTIRKTDLILAIKDKIIPAVPSNGPLFPGTPEQRYSRYTIVENENELDSVYGMEAWLENSNHTTDDEALHFIMRGMNFIVFQNIKTYLQEGFIMYKLVANGQDYTNNFYGYCWQE